MNEGIKNVLAIDTATRRLNLAVMYEGDRSVKSSDVIPKTHGQVLLKKIDDLLSSARLSSSDLQAIVVSLGPGSFTGLRIGLAAAKGIAVGCDIPIVGVTLFEVAALRLKHVENCVYILIPSRKGEFYLGTLNGDATGDSDICVVNESELAARVGHEQVYTIGCDPQLLKEGILGLTSRTFDFDGGDVLQAGLEKLSRGMTSDLAMLEPVYFQKAIAEIRFDQRHGSG